MKTYFILSAVGKDRPGIVSDVSEVIYECGGNIEDSSMNLLRNHFTLLLLFSTEREEVNQKLSSGLKRLEWEKNLTVFHSPVTLEEAHPGAKEEAHLFKISTSGVDHAGILPHSGGHPGREDGLRHPGQGARRDALRSL